MMVLMFHKKIINILNRFNLWWWGLLTIGILLPVFTLFLSFNGFVIIQDAPEMIQSLNSGKLILSALVISGICALLSLAATILWLKATSREQHYVDELDRLQDYLDYSNHIIAELQEQNEMLAAMREISRVLARDIDLDNLLPEVMTIIRDYAEPESAAIYLPSSDNKYELQCALIRGKILNNPQIDNEIDKNVIKALECRQVQREESNKRVVLYIPFELEENNLGVFQLSREVENYDADRNKVFTMRVTSFIQHIALVVKHMMLFDRATRDGLTKLFNRRYFDLQLERWISLSNRKNTDLSLILIDIDHFKKVNDNHGHQSGDLILQNVSDVIHQEIRQMDAAYRYGGEEMVIILPQTSLSETRLIAERIRNSIAKSIFRTVANKKLKITVSAGIAEYSASETKKNFIERVDAALYNAKAKGRNRVCESTTPDHIFKVA